MCNLYKMKCENSESDPCDKVLKTYFRDITNFKRGDEMAWKYAFQRPYWEWGRLSCYGYGYRVDLRQAFGSVDERGKMTFFFSNIVMGWKIK